MLVNSRLRVRRFSWVTFNCVILVALCLLGCDGRNSMARQPRKKPLDSSPFFEDGGASRQLPEGTVIAMSVREYYEQRSKKKESATQPHGADTQQETLRMLQSGKEQFEIWCTPCHGAAGYGDGMVVRRGFPTPPSYHIPRLRQASDEHFKQVIENGLGTMPAYGGHVTDEERDAIIAYIRALQLSQYAPVSTLPADVRGKLPVRASTHTAQARSRLLRRSRRREL